MKFGLPTKPQHIDRYAEDEQDSAPCLLPESVTRRRDFINALNLTVSTPRTKVWNGLLKTAFENEARLKSISLEVHSTLQSTAQPKTAFYNPIKTSVETDRQIGLLQKKNQDMLKDVEKCIEEVHYHRMQIKKSESIEKDKLVKEAAQKQLAESQMAEKQRLAAEQLKLRQENELKLNLEKKALIEKEKAQAATVTNDIISDDSSIALKQYEVLRIKTESKAALASNPTMQQQLFLKKMKITERVGQLMNSVAKIKEIATTLDSIFIEGKKLSNLGYEWLMDLTAKAIVKQSEKEVAVNRSMNQTPEEFKMSVGYKKIDGDFESENQYVERMNGIVALYACIVQTKLIANGHGIEHGWVWMARILNHKPMKITAVLLHTFLEIAGHELLATYKLQGHKMIRFIGESYLNMIPEKAIAARTRLQLFLEETFLRTNDIPAHEGHAINH